MLVRWKVRKLVCVRFLRGMPVVQSVRVGFTGMRSGYNEEMLPLT